MGTPPGGWLLPGPQLPLNCFSGERAPFPLRPPLPVPAAPTPTSWSWPWSWSWEVEAAQGKAALCCHLVETALGTAPASAECPQGMEGLRSVGQSRCCGQRALGGISTRAPDQS